MAFQLKSSAIQSADPIARKYTCNGADVSPPLRWDTPPAGTQSLALLCDDPDAPMGTWSHWVIYNLPPAGRELAENQPPGRAHRYFFRLYALDLEPSLAPGLTRKGLLRAIEGHVLTQAELRATHARG